MTFFVNQKKHKTNNTWENNIHVKDNSDAAYHQYHAFLSTYGYGQDATVDYCACSIEDENGGNLIVEVDDRRAPEVEEPEEVPEE